MNELVDSGQGSGVAAAEGSGPRFRVLPDDETGLQSCLDEFFAWYGEEPRPGFTKATVAAWRVALEARGLGAVSINVRITAVRKLAVEAVDNGLANWPTASLACGAWPPRACGSAIGSPPSRPKLCRAAGGELEQIQMLLGHSSVQTTERHLERVCDRAAAAIWLLARRRPFRYGPRRANAFDMMAEDAAELVIMLTAAEVEALERAIKECTTNTGSGDVKLLKAIERKINLAHEGRSQVNRVTDRQ